jgi:molecular chaperone HtpG
MNEIEERHPFKLHLPDLLKVLAEHLYADKHVAVRELIQNAHDSCLRRAVEGRDLDYQPRLEVTIDAARQMLTISDNGCGLTAAEIDTYLATIGRSYTRELRERLAVMSHQHASELIGQFGFGFLSAFLIASEVVLVTRSVKGDGALRWRSAGDESYSLEPAERAEAGTTIQLRVKPGAAFVLQESLLLETIQKYADFLPIPIHVNGGAHRVNMMAAPWESLDALAAMHDYVARAFGRLEPLCIIPLHDHRVDLGHDALLVPLQGFLFVPPSSVASVREYGDMRVYIRRMFICENERDLLPPWARFVRGVLDCPGLQPTASREGIHQDDMFEAVRQAVEEQLLQALRRLADEEPSTWRRLVHSHTDVIKGWAVKDSGFFEQVADLVTFHTSRGHLTLPDYLRQSGGILYYVTRELGSLQDQLLAEGHDVPVIDASWFAVLPFLEKYADFRPGIRLVRLDGEATQLLHPVPDEEYAALLDAYRRRNVRARVVAFKPAEVPALMLYPQDAEFILETRGALDAGEIPGPLAGLIATYLHDSGTSEEDLKGTLYLNAACPLIGRLNASPEDTPARDATLTLIYQVARLFAGRTLTVAGATGAFGEAIQALEVLLP